jgi:trigger factor
MIYFLQRRVPLLKVTVERIPDSQVLLNIEIEPERVQSSIDQAYKRLAPRARIPGFRPGKAPRALVERHYGKEMLLHDALDRLVPEVVEEAIKAEEIDIIDRPALEIESLEPVIVKATVPVRPTVDLGDYRSLRVERDSIEVDPARIDESLQSLRERYATVEPVERPVEEGDTIRADVKALAEGKELVDGEDVELTVTETATKGLPGLYPKLLGLESGTTETFEVPAPEDAGEALAGKPITYTVTVRDVKARVLPDLDDEFAKEVGESFPTLDALRERLESDLRTRLETEAEQKLENDALDKLVEQSTIEFPPQLVEREIERLLRDQGVPGDDRRTFERFLQQAGLGEEELREQFRPVASQRIKRAIVLGKLQDLEKITVSAEDIDEELTLIGAGGPQGERLRELFDTESGRETIERSLLNRRTVERLRLIAAGQALDLAVEDKEAAPETPEPAPDAESQDDASSAAAAADEAEPGLLTTEFTEDTE